MCSENLLFHTVLFCFWQGNQNNWIEEGVKRQFKPSQMLWKKNSCIDSYHREVGTVM